MKVWKKLYDALTALFLLSQRVERLEKQGEEMRRDMQKLTIDVELLAHQIARLSDRERLERVNLALKLENEMLRFEHRLPPAKDEGS